MTVLVTKVVSAYYTNYYINSSSSGSNIVLYSQNSGNDYQWLDPYIDSEVEMYVGIQELNLKSSGSVWRPCAIAVIKAD
jgi:hypothetical protein